MPKRINISILVGAILLGSLSALARAEGIAVIVHPSIDINTISLTQVKQIYLGFSKLLTPYDHYEESSLRARFYKQLTGRNIRQIRSIWAALVFSGKAQLPERLLNSNAVKTAVANDPNAISYIKASEVDDRVQVLLTLSD
jgi:ABC-type phosphate transport system substrate-binding protein